MFFSYIHQFQMHIFMTLSNNQELMTSIDKIYLSTPHDAKYPFLVINIASSVNLSQKDIPIYEINFEFAIFTRDKTQNTALHIADKISNALAFANANFNNYRIAGMRLSDIKFDKARDLISNKALMSYKVIIKQEVV